jgi:hypothetical protein
MKSGTYILIGSFFDIFGMYQEFIFISPLKILIIGLILLNRVKKELIFFHLHMWALFMGQKCIITAIEWINMMRIGIIGYLIKLLLPDLF